MVTSGSSKPLHPSSFVFSCMHQGLHSLRRHHLQLLMFAENRQLPSKDSCNMLQMRVLRPLCVLASLQILLGLENTKRGTGSSAHCKALHTFQMARKMVLSNLSCFWMTVMPLTMLHFHLFRKKMQVMFLKNLFHLAAETFWEAMSKCLKIQMIPNSRFLWWGELCLLCKNPRRH